MILSCSCLIGPGGNQKAIAFQDALYGVGNRVHTLMAKEDTYRCTVCHHERARKTGDDAKSKKAEKSEKSDKKLAKSKG